MFSNFIKYAIELSSNIDINQRKFFVQDKVSQLELKMSISQ